MGEILKEYSGSLLILLITALILGVLVPQLLRAYRHALELHHAERMRLLEQGQTPPPTNEQSQAAGRTAVLVPIVVVCAAATVTCFLVAFHSENLFAVALAAWSVAGVISLAAITGGVSLMARLAHVNEDDAEVPEESAQS